MERVEGVRAAVVVAVMVKKTGDGSHGFVHSFDRWLEI